MIELINITKAYDGITVNNKISCEIQQGQVHAFLGENGAGKSTLMKILAGYVKPDSGVIKINDREVVIKSPADARSYGIGMVHQQFSLIDKLTIFENLVIGDKRIPVYFSKKKVKDQIRALLKDIDIDLDINESVGALTLSDKQLVEIAKLLWYESDILIMDEPLSQLSFFEGVTVLNLIRRIVKQKGKTVLLISHNIAEIVKYSDRITVLRNGQLVKTVSATETSEDELANLMIGGNATKEPIREDLFSNNIPLLSIRDLCTKQRNGFSDIPLRDINMDIMKGEILGIAGVKNNGQESFFSVLHGNIIAEKGTITVNNSGNRSKTLHKELMISYIPVDGAGEASMPDMTITENLLFKKIGNGEFNKGIFLKKEQMSETANAIIGKYGIRAASPSVMAKNLSGGNLQKSIIARELESDWKLLLASNPLAGLDFKFSNYLVDLFIQYKSEGRSILFQSNNVPHLFEVCDRIAVFYRGGLIAILTKNEFDLDRIAALMGGVNNQQIYETSN